MLHDFENEGNGKQCTFDDMILSYILASGISITIADDDLKPEHCSFIYDTFREERASTLSLCQKQYISE
ncbi:hypothetical protein JW960_16960 [candidate division KSB1 bacterium]|nr:hypothetical protein [candidate division KSB1 bacterium]